MEERTETAKSLCCFGCLCTNDENPFEAYNFECAHLRAIFQADCLYLCYLCKRMAQHAELFIQNVQSNQILLENFHSADATLQTVNNQIQPLVNLVHVPLALIELSEDNAINSEESFSVTYSTGNSRQAKVKLEMKEEDSDMPDHLEGEFMNGDDGCEGQDLDQVPSPQDKIAFPCAYKSNQTKELEPTPFILNSYSISDLDRFNSELSLSIHNGREDDFQDTYVKEEEFKELLKQELQLDLDLMTQRSLKGRREKKKNRKREGKKTDGTRSSIPVIPKIERIYITKKQCMQEREQMAKEKKYLNSTYKCEDCIKGYTFKESFEKHLDKHNENRGEYICDICKQRMNSEEKLASHRNYHTVRYKCPACDLTRVTRLTIKEHYTSMHCDGYLQYVCPHCSKSFKRQVSLRKHIGYVHMEKQRVSCAYCQKSYANKEVLKTHMIMKHPKEVSAGEVRKRYICQDCNKAFRAPSLLNTHRIKHSHTRNYYCVECDKSFKSDSILKHHLKTTMPHVNYIELPLVCLHCEKRFAIRRDLDRHMNRVHLNIKPFQCDRCDKAYVNGWSLTEHKRLVHEGYKRPLKFPCPMCDKIFNRNQILKGHIRTHTGERPYQCSKCPAQFSQASILGTHVKLIHHKLTRDGRPKAVSMK